MPSLESKESTPRDDASEGDWPAVTSWLDVPADTRGKDSGTVARRHGAPRVEENLWRQGHHRPWWQWNVLTLFGALFALVWLRYLLSLPQTAVWTVAIAILLAWFFVPLYRIHQHRLRSMPDGSWLHVVGSDLRRLQNRQDLGWVVRLTCYVVVIYLTITLLLAFLLIWRRVLMEPWEFLR